LRDTVSKRAAQKFDMEVFNLKKPNGVEGKEHYQFKISYKFAAWENLDDDYDVDIHRA
jgi:hypothetical protein